MTAHRKDRCDRHGDRDVLPRACTICARMAIEQEIARLTVETLIEAGYLLNVQNGGDRDELDNPSSNVDEIIGAMFDTDEEFLVVYRVNTIVGSPRVGWVRFIYGNSGWDVINGYSTNLERALSPVNNFIDTLR